MTLEQQQLAEALEQNLVLSKQTDHTILDLSDYVDSLEQQLSAALAACKLKDEALQQEYDYQKANDIEIAFWLEEALAIQPDDSALKAWLGEPITKVIHYDEVGMPHTIYLNKPLYSPKGLK
jgi:hypothetical protein